MPRNRSENGPLADPQVYEYIKAWCARERIALGQPVRQYVADPAWKAADAKRRDIWVELPPHKKNAVRAIPSERRQVVFDAA